MQHTAAQTSALQRTTSHAYSTREVAALLGVHRMTVNRLITSGALAAFNVGSDARPRLRVLASTLHAFQTANQISA